jgi:hypothetical protein
MPLPEFSVAQARACALVGFRSERHAWNGNDMAKSIDQDARLRGVWREHFERCAQLSQAYHAASDRFIESGGATARPRQPQYPAFPDECRGMPCGARTRRGTPCKRTDLEINGRCKFHGGRSRGPTSIAGKAASIANLSRRWPIGTP